MILFYLGFIQFRPPALLSCPFTHSHLISINVKLNDTTTTTTNRIDFTEVTKSKEKQLKPKSNESHQSRSNTHKLHYKCQKR